MLLVELPLTTLPKIISRDIALNKERQTLKPFSTKAISRQVQNDNALSWEGIRDLNTLETRMLFLASNATRNIQQANSCSDFGQVFFTKVPFRNRVYFIYVVENDIRASRNVFRTLVTPLLFQWFSLKSFCSEQSEYYFILIIPKVSFSQAYNFFNKDV